MKNIQRGSCACSSRASEVPGGKEQDIPGSGAEKMEHEAATFRGTSCYMTKNSSLQRRGEEEPGKGGIREEVGVWRGLQERRAEGESRV